jgi:hypothetical protein
MLRSVKNGFDLAIITKITSMKRERVSEDASRHNQIPRAACGR